MRQASQKCTELEVQITYSAGMAAKALREVQTVSTCQWLRVLIHFLQRLEGEAVGFFLVQSYLIQLNWQAPEEMRKKANETQDLQGVSFTRWSIYHLLRHAPNCRPPTMGSLLQAPNVMRFSRQNTNKSKRTKQVCVGFVPSI
jgi:hypothetical protein